MAFLEKVNISKIVTEKYEEEAKIHGYHDESIKAHFYVLQDVEKTRTKSPNIYL